MSESCQTIGTPGENQEMRHNIQLADHIMCRCDHGQIRVEITSNGETHDSVPATLEIPCPECQDIIERYRLSV